MNEIFGICVWILEVSSKWLGLTYKELNVIIFVIIQPLLTIGLIVWVIKLKSKLNNILKLKLGK